MKLYHFTNVTNVAAIKANGLWPSDDEHQMVGGKRVVWLTELPDTRITEAESAKVFARTGEHARQWLKFGDKVPLARLTVRIGTHDRKLVQYLPWLRKNPWPGCPGLDDAFVRGRIMTANWIFLATSRRTKLLRATSPRYRKRKPFVSLPSACTERNFHAEVISPQLR